MNLRKWGLIALGLAFAVVAGKSRCRSVRSRARAQRQHLSQGSLRARQSEWRRRAASRMSSPTRAATELERHRRSPNATPVRLWPGRPAQRLRDHDQRHARRIAIVDAYGYRQRRIRPRRLSRAVRPSRRAPPPTAASRRSTRTASRATIRATTPAGRRSPRSTSTWPARCARAASSSWSKRRRDASPTSRPR